MMNSFVNYNIVFDDYFEAIAYQKNDEKAFHKAHKEIREARMAKGRNGDITLLLPFDWREDPNKTLRACRNEVANLAESRRSEDDERMD